jgi:outer membrane translocation and assembly module TamA
MHPQVAPAIFDFLISEALAEAKGAQVYVGVGYHTTRVTLVDAQGHYKMDWDLMKASSETIAKEIAGILRTR